MFAVKVSPGNVTIVKGRPVHDTLYFNAFDAKRAKKTLQPRDGIPIEVNTARLYERRLALLCVIGHLKSVIVNKSSSVSCQDEKAFN